MSEEICIDDIIVDEPDDDSSIDPNNSLNDSLSNNNTDLANNENVISNSIVNIKVDSSDDSDDSSDFEDIIHSNKENIPDEWLIDEELDEDNAITGPLRTKNEIIEEIIEEIPNEFSLESDTLISAGYISSYIESENILLIKSNKNSITLLEGTMICWTNKQIIGRIYEVFGPITEPYYVIKLPKSKSNNDYSINNELFAIYRENLILTQEMITQYKFTNKGSDASNAYDEEIGEDEQEFSDDEKEQKIKQQNKAAKKHGKDGNIINQSNNNNSNQQKYAKKNNCNPSNSSGYQQITTYNQPIVTNSTLYPLQQNTYNTYPNNYSLSQPVYPPYYLHNQPSYPTSDGNINQNYNTPYHYNQYPINQAPSAQLPWAGFGSGSERLLNDFNQQNKK